MVNTQKIKGRMVEKKYNLQTLAPEIHCSPYTLGRKLANKDPIWLHEVEKLCYVLDITEGEFYEFFLVKMLQKSNEATSHI